MNVLCLMIGHHRSRRFAAFNFNHDQWESFCTRCGVRVARDGEGWHRETSLERSSHNAPFIACSTDTPAVSGTVEKTAEGRPSELT